MAAQRFDMIVIGAGPGGYVAAIRGAQLGLRVAIVEREHMGGICLNWGCIPTKALLRSAEVFHLMRRAGEFGLQTGSLGFDLDAMINRSRKIAQRLNSGIGHLMKKNAIRSFMGKAALKEPDLVEIRSVDGTQTLQADNIVLATGARARELPGMEVDGDLVWTYRHALKPPRMPKRLLVIGSGAIGIEFASFYNTLGANTTVVEVMDRILPVEDEEVSAFAQKAFEKQGMTIRTDTTVRRLDRSDGEVTATIDTSGKLAQEDFDTVITAVGIVGNTEGLGLENLGVRVEKTHVVVDRLCHTGVAGIHAIGDLAGPPWLAHKASHEAVMVAEKIAGGNPHPVDAGAIAGCTYCHPQIASVGLTEAQAKAAGFDIRIGRFPFVGNGKAIALGEPEGFIKTVFDAGNGALLGAHMVGAEVTELIQGYVVARQLETTEEDMVNTVFPHPTLSEMMHESVLDSLGRAIHI